jgi:hypothetical protein
LLRKKGGWRSAVVSGGSRREFEMKKRGYSSGFVIGRLGENRCSAGCGQPDVRRNRIEVPERGLVGAEGSEGGIGAGFCRGCPVLVVENDFD